MAGRTSCAGRLEQRLLRDVARTDRAANDRQRDYEPDENERRPAEEAKQPWCGPRGTALGGLAAAENERPIQQLALDPNQAKGELHLSADSQQFNCFLLTLD